VVALRYVNTRKEGSNAGYVLVQHFANMENGNLAVVNVDPNHSANTGNRSIIV
jgi:hypothetical protein